MNIEDKYLHDFETFISSNTVSNADLAVGVKREYTGSSVHDVADLLSLIRIQWLKGPKGACPGMKSPISGNASGVS
jgi:hypothetical protein